MLNKKITFIAQFPPPIHGLSKAVETLYESRLNRIFDFKAVNTAINKDFLKTIYNIVTADTDAFYFTISQTKGGLWRDIMLMALMEWKRKPLIIHLHGGYLRTLMDKDCGAIQRWLACKVIGKAANCIVLGNSLRYIFKGVIDDCKITVVPNCVDDEYLVERNVLDKKIAEIANSNVLHIMYLSNFIVSKGYREVLMTAKFLHDKGCAKRYKFHFAGKFFEQSEKEYFESFIKDNNLQDIVKYHGIVSGDSKRDLLKMCNISMLPTRYPNEGQPISILEAMGNGMSVVTTDHAGIPDISNKRNGFVCMKNDINVKDIAAYLEHCHDNRKDFIETAKYNYDKVINGYTQKKYIDNMENVFLSCFDK